MRAENARISSNPKGIGGIRQFLPECRRHKADGKRALRDDDGMPDTPGRFYALPAQERDRLILQLRRQRWTHARIGERVGMSESGVRRALERIRTGGFGEGMTRS
jgi:hypothetical protein